MSANLIVDLMGTTDRRASIMIGSGASFTVGEICDLLQADTYTNVWIAGGVGAGSGAIEIRLQTSPDTTSGNFTDPTSGLASLPVNVVSGGVIWANSGLWNSGNFSEGAPVNNAPMFCSGGMFGGAFQSPNRYMRLINNSGFFPGAITAGFIKQKRTTGSGAGFTYAPGSGVINV